MAFSIYWADFTIVKAAITKRTIFGTLKVIGWITQSQIMVLFSDNFTFQLLLYYNWSLVVGNRLVANYHFNAEFKVAS